MFVCLSPMVSSHQICHLLLIVHHPFSVFFSFFGKQGHHLLMFNIFSKNNFIWSIIFYIGVYGNSFSSTREGCLRLESGLSFKLKLCNFGWNVIQGHWWNLRELMWLSKSPIIFFWVPCNMWDSYAIFCNIWLSLSHVLDILVSSSLILLGIGWGVVFSISRMPNLDDTNRSLVKLD